MIRTSACASDLGGREMKVMLLLTKASASGATQPPPSMKQSFPIACIPKPSVWERGRQVAGEVSQRDPTGLAV